MMKTAARRTSLSFSRKWRKRAPRASTERRTTGMPGKELKRGDACPNCAGELRAAVVPTADQRRLAEDREVRQPLPYGADTASEQQRDELGELFVCDRCGYKTRFPLEAHKPRAAGKSPAVADAARRLVFPAANLPLVGGRVVPIPSPFYVTGEDRLRIVSMASVANVVVAVRYRLAADNGEVIVQGMEHR